MELDIYITTTKQIQSSGAKRKNKNCAKEGREQAKEASWHQLFGLDKPNCKHNTQQHGSS
jgi:hypothetical protein